jgi:hypothetical protein
VEQYRHPVVTRTPAAPVREAVAELSFRCGPARIELSAAGVVTAVLHDATPETSLVTSAGELRAVVDGAPVVWGRPLLSVDADEVEVSWVAGDLRLVVRHTFALGWGIRVALSNTASRDLTLEDPLLTWRVPDDRPAWALAAGAAGSFAVLPPSGAGPLLGGVLRVGALSAASADGLHLGRLVLPPSGRYVVQWHWDFYATPRDFDRGRHPDVPRRLDLTVGEAVTVSASEDEALVADDGLLVETVRDQVELTASEAGSFPVELRSARGVTSYTLRSAEPLEALLQRAATSALDRPRTASGVVPLPDVDAALAVQRALASTLLEEPDVAEEALDLYTARLPEEPPADPRTVGYLCGEHSRTADPELLRQATRMVLASWEPLPGLGMAGTELCLARLLAGEPVAPVLDHLVRLAAESDLTAGSVPLVEQAALLELEVVTMARLPAAGGGRTAQPLAGRVTALGGWLGAGLKGRAVTPLPVEVLAHLTAVLSLLPEPASAELRPRWGCTAHELARRGQAEVLCRLGGQTAGPALSWLVLGTGPD